MTDAGHTGTTLKLSFSRRADGKLFRAYRGSFVCGEIFLNENHVNEAMHGWYAYEVREGRQSQQKKPSASPADAALKMWGPKGRDLVAAFPNLTPRQKAALSKATEGRP